MARQEPDGSRIRSSCSEQRPKKESGSAGTADLDSASTAKRKYNQDMEGGIDLMYLVQFKWLGSGCLLRGKEGETSILTGDRTHRCIHMMVVLRGLFFARETPFTHIVLTYMPGHSRDGVCQRRTHTRGLWCKRSSLRQRCL